MVGEPVVIWVVIELMLAIAPNPGVVQAAVTAATAAATAILDRITSEKLPGLSDEIPLMLLIFLNMTLSPNLSRVTVVSQVTALGIRENETWNSHTICRPGMAVPDGLKPQAHACPSTKMRRLAYAADRDEPTLAGRRTSCGGVPG